MRLLMRKLGLVALDERGHRIPMSFLRVGIIIVAIVIWGVYLGFTKTFPWHTSFKMSATFADALNIRPGSPVRIAGVDVGKVTGADHKDGTALTTVNMEIDEAGLPIHSDAALKIRPRLFLGGNYFVELEAGSPEESEIESGDVIPVAQTASSVELGEVATMFQRDVRANAQNVVQELGSALAQGNQKGLGKADGGIQSPPGPPPTYLEQKKIEEDTTVKALEKGTSAGVAINRALPNVPPGLKAGAEVERALLGTQAGDLRRLIDGLGSAVAALDRAEPQLNSLISNAATVTGALASQSGNLEASLAELPRTLAVAEPALEELNAALPPLREVSHDALPGVREIPATVDATLPWIAQANELMDEDELGGLAKSLSEAAPNLASMANESTILLPELDDASLCATKVVLPTLKTVINDPPQSNLVSPWFQNYQLAILSIVGLAGTAQSFDGNGSYLRAIVPGGTNAVTTGNVNGDPDPDDGGGPLVGLAPNPILGYRPAFPGSKPPLNFDALCHQNTKPDVNGAATAGAAGGGSVSAQTAGTVGLFPKADLERALSGGSASKGKDGRAAKSKHGKKGKKDKKGKRKRGTGSGRGVEAGPVGKPDRGGDRFENPWSGIQEVSEDGVSPPARTGKPKTAFAGGNG